MRDRRDLTALCPERGSLWVLMDLRAVGGEAEGAAGPWAAQESSESQEWPVAPAPPSFPHAGIGHSRGRRSRQSPGSAHWNPGRPGKRPEGSDAMPDLLGRMEGLRAQEL